MSEHTGELRQGIEYAKRLNLDTGLDSYPIFSEAYRPRLNRVILEHYWLREVGQESYELFFFELRRRLYRDMPMFNQAYLAIANVGDILSTYEIKSVNKGTTKSSSTESGESTNTSSTKSGSLSSQFPQQMLKSDGDYATSGGRSSSSSDGTGTSTGRSTAETINDALNDSSGRQGSVTRLMGEYLSSYINVDGHVLNNLSDLFMNVWSSGQRIVPEPIPWIMPPFFPGFMYGGRF